MELSKHIPITFEVGDIVMLSNESISDDENQWKDSYNNTLAIIIDVDWRFEHLKVKNCVGFISNGLFNEFKLLRKNSRLGRLIS